MSQYRVNHVRSMLVAHYVISIGCVVAIGMGSAWSLRDELATAVRYERENVARALALQQLTADQLNAIAQTQAELRALRQEVADWQQTITQTVMLDVMQAPEHAFRRTVLQRLHGVEAWQAHE